MASGDSHQWGFHQYPQPSDHGATQAGGYLGHSFQRDGDDGGGSNANTNSSFGLAHQWQTPQDNQFMQQNGFSYQPQGQAFSTQQFPAGTSHTQTHQHPQAFSSTMSLEGPKDLPWDYSFGFETTQLAGLAEDGGSYGGVPSNSHFSHAVPNTIAGQQPQHHQRQQPQQNTQQPHHQAQQAQHLQQQHPQQQQHPHPHPHQHQLNAGHPSSQVYTPGRVVGYGRNVQQPQPQAMAQSMNSRPAVEFQQSVTSQHQQQQQQQQQQQPNPLQAGSRQNPQLQSLNQPQQISRVGTPQSMAPVNEARQSPFTGRAVPPMPMQQQGNHNQFPVPDTRGSPAVPFSLPQQTSTANSSANVPNNPTTQSRFMAPQLVAPQRPSQSPVPQLNTPALPNTMSRGQTDNQLMFQHAVQSNAKPNSQLASQPRVGTLTTTATTAWQEQQPRPGVEQPRVIGKDENAIPFYGSRYVGFGFAIPVQMNPDADENQTIRDVTDPSEYAGLSFGDFFPSANGQPRILASQILQNWASALVQGDLAGQTEQERRLRQHFGGSIPKRYEDKLHKFKSLHQKSLVSTGPERSSTRPAKEADAAEWDALGIVYLTNPQPTSSEIGVAVAQYGKLIRQHSIEFSKLKVRLKNARAADEVAVKEQIAKKLDTIHRAVTAANSWGDPQVIANLGGNQKLISDFVSCLIYANNTGDHNGQVPKDVLRLLAQVTTIDREFLMDSLQFAKISKKFESKGDSEVKGFVRAIKENAKAKDEASKVPGSGDERTSTPEASTIVKTSSSTYSKATTATDLTKKKNPTPTNARALSTASSIKRAGDEDVDTKAVKRIAVEPVSAQLPQPGPKAAPSKVVVSAPNVSGTKLFGNGMLGNKTKLPTKPTSKTAPVKLENAKIGAPTTKPESKKELIKPLKYELLKGRKAEPAKVELSTASKLGGIGALLDEISNSKPKPTGRSTPDREMKVDRDETPEEKARRLRKEKRRHLRVSWKEGDALTEVREFHKDVDEDEGRASNMIRDARDDRSEGMQLRKANQAQFKDEDEDEPAEEWSTPIGIDFSTIPQDQRSKSSVARGGLVTFETQQQRLIAQREKTELMVIYTDPTDIPPTPKSPHTSTQEDTDMQTGAVYDLAQDDPKVAEVHLRWAEAGSRGLSWARLTAVRRAQKGQSATVSDVANMASPAQLPANSTPSPPQARPMSREEQVLLLLTSDRVRNYVDPDPYDPADPKTHRRHDYVYPELQRAADKVEDLVDLMKGKPYPPNEPPEWMKNDTARTAEWWQGYNKDKQRAEQQATTQAAQAAPAPQPEVPSQAAVQATHQAAQTAVDPNMAAWMALAQLQQQGQAQTNAYTQAYRDAYTAAYQGAQTAQPPQQMASAQTAGDSNANLQAALAALSGITTASNQQQPVLQPNSSDPELQALLASLAQTTAQQNAQTYPAQAPPFQMPAANDPNMLAYIMALAANQTPGQGDQQARLQQQQIMSSNGREQHQRDDSRERSSRKRERDREEDHDGMHPSRRDKHRGHKAARGGDIPAHLRGINRDKIGTKPCTFWAKGQCQKGEQCTFRHD